MPVHVNTLHCAQDAKNECKKYEQDNLKNERGYMWLMNPDSDSAEYKMWGNGVALPCVLYVMEGIAEILKKEGR